LESKEETFLDEICGVWEEYKTATQRIRDILLYMVKNNI
jgi:hypothetical protein